MLQQLKFYARHNLFTSRQVKLISSYYRLDDNQLQERYNKAFLDIFKTAYTKSPFYNKLYKEYGINISDIKDLSDIRKLPSISKKEIRANVDEIFIGNRFLRLKGYTSGTSGSPLTVYRTPQSILKEQAYMLNYRNQQGFVMGNPLLSLRGAIGKNSLYKYDKIANILYISSYNLNIDTIRIICNVIQDFAPQAVEAYPSSLYTLCLLLEKEKGFSLNIPLTFTSSETLYDFQRRKIESTISTKIFDWYGNAERTICIAQNNGTKYFPLPLYSINEYYSNYSITTGLINKSFPIIRYKVDDEISVEGNDFISNIIAPKILKVEGRTDDSILLKDGSMISRLGNAFKGCGNIDYAQIHQFNVNMPLTVKLVVGESFSSMDLEKINGNLVHLLGKDTLIDYVYCNREDLTLTSRGKFKLVVRHF